MDTTKSIEITISSDTLEIIRRVAEMQERSINDFIVAVAQEAAITIIEQEARKDLVKQQIEQAFGDVKYPGDDNLVLDNCFDCSDCAEVLTGKHWREIQLDDLVPKCTILFNLRDEAKVFYTAAFMLLSIDFYDDSSSLAKSLIWWFEPNDSLAPLEAGKEFEDKILIYNESQIKAIEAFMEYMRDEYELHFTEESTPQKILNAIRTLSNK